MLCVYMYSEDQRSQHQLYWSGDTDSGPAYPQPYVLQSSSSSFSTRPPLREDQCYPFYPQLVQPPSLYQDRHSIVSGPPQPGHSTVAVSSFNTSAYQPGPPATSTPQLYDPSLPWMSQNLFTSPPFRPPSPHQAVFTYSPQGSNTPSLPTGPGPPGLLPGQPVNIFGALDVL